MSKLLGLLDYVFSLRRDFLAYADLGGTEHGGNF